MSCGDSCAVSKLKSRKSVEVNIDIDNNNDIWLMLFDTELTTILPKHVLKTAQMVTELENMKDFEVTYDTVRLVVKGINTNA